MERNNNEWRDKYDKLANQNENLLTEIKKNTEEFVNTKNNDIKKLNDAYNKYNNKLKEQDLKNSKLTQQVALQKTDLEGHKNEILKLNEVKSLLEDNVNKLKQSNDLLMKNFSN